jgi:glutamyl-Q tRNA(Asp) synthetase
MAGVSRFAPSATGRAHPGTLLAALLCWLDARQRGARLVLRVEDLDPERCSPALVNGLIEDLAWFGLDWDALEIQSAHRQRHEAALDTLAELGVLYPCNLSRSELRALGRPGPDGAWMSDHRHRGQPLPAGGWRACDLPLRVRLPGTLADPVVRRRDGAIAYHLAAVVDDAAVGVTRIVRGRDLATSTATQVALQELLGLPTPTYQHHALLLDGDLTDPGISGKFAKFHGAVAVPELQQSLSAEVLCGILAAAIGLRPTAQPLTPQALHDDFTWAAVSEHDVTMRWTGSTLEVVSAPQRAAAVAPSAGTYAWLTPAAPAAIAIAAMPALATAFDRPLPKLDEARFMRLLNPRGETVDELVVERIASDRLHLMPHGGPGVRQAVDACLQAHGLQEHRLPPTSGGEDASLWAALAQAPSPAAVAWLLANPHAEPPFAREFLRRPPLILITGPANAGKSTLLNHWCGRRRALISDIPGTTRDLVAAETLIDGWRVRLLDSAGLRPTDDPLEQAGQALVAAARTRADVVISLCPPGADQPQAAGDLVVWGKADLRPSLQPSLQPSRLIVAPDEGPPPLLWSANEAAAGLARLGRAVRERLGLPAGPSG